MKMHILAIALFALIFTASPAKAQEAIGVIAEIENSASILLAGSPEDTEAVAVQIGQEVHMNDIILTGEDSRAHLLLIDDTEITLGSNSEFKIDEYVFTEDTPETNRAKFSILRGPFLFVSGLVSKRETPDVTIDTTYGSIGLRGTTVWGGMLDERDYSVFLLDGEVTYQTKRGRVKLTPGQGTDAYSDRAIPSRAKIWAQPKIDAAVATIALRDPEAVQARITELKQTHQALRKSHNDNLQQRQEEKQETQKEKQQERLENKTENRTRYVPETRTETTTAVEEEMPAPPAMPVEPVIEDDLSAHVPEPDEAEAPDEEQVMETIKQETENIDNIEAPKTPEAPDAPKSTEPVEIPAEETAPSMPPIPREGNDAPDFEKWEQQHIQRETGIAPSAL